MEGFQDLMNSLQSNLAEVETKREKAERRFDRQERRTDKLEEEGAMFPGYNYRVRRKKEKEKRNKRLRKLDRSADKIRDQIARVGLSPEEVGQLDKKDRFEDLLNKQRGRLSKVGKKRDKTKRFYNNLVNAYEDMAERNTQGNTFSIKIAEAKKKGQKRDRKFNKREDAIMNTIARLEDKQSKFLETLGE